MAKKLISGAILARLLQIWAPFFFFFLFVTLVVLVIRNSSELSSYGI